LIGDSIDDPYKLINGAVVCIRPKMNRISLWLRDFQPTEAVMKVNNSAGMLEESG
jgi:hypothetical protein